LANLDVAGRINYNSLCENTTWEDEVAQFRCPENNAPCSINTINTRL